MGVEMTVGSRWADAESGGRVIVITSYHPDNGAWFRYEDDPRQSPWTCCIEDFYIWNRFRRLP